MLKSLILIYRARGQCIKILKNLKPSVVLATGGYVSAPAIWAAAQCRVPVLIYLPDLEPGLAIRALSRWATKVAVSFDEVKGFFPAGKAVVTGYPVREEFQGVTKPEARARLGLNLAQPVLTIFGGSQGAHSINQAVRGNLSELLQAGQVVHISGAQDEGTMQGHRAGLDEGERARYHLYAYLDKDMPMALAAADLVVARAGAATLGEFPAVAAPSVLVPYPFAGKHQEKNANFLVSRGGAVKIDDDRLERDLVPTVKNLLADPDRLEKMSTNMRALAQPNAAKNIANLLSEIAA